jgi:hypothetical protein
MESARQIKSHEARNVDQMIMITASLVDGGEAWHKSKFCNVATIAVECSWGTGMLQLASTRTLACYS